MVCVDLDGTLLNSKHQVCEKSLSVLRKLSKQGVVMVVATGRPAFEAKRYASLIGDQAYYLGSNGTIAGSVSSEEAIFENAFSLEHLDDLLQFSIEHQLNPIFSTSNRLYVSSRRDYWMQRFFSYKTNKNLKSNVSLVKNPLTIKALLISSKENAHKVIFFVSNLKKLRKMEPLLRALPLYETAITSGVCVEVTPKGINKGHGVEKLSRHLGIQPSEVIAFGDSENDFEMLKMVGCGIAMGNATPHVKSVANQVTKSNDENGIGTALEALFQL